MTEADIFASQMKEALEILRNNNEKGLTVEEMENAAQAEAQSKAEKRKEKRVAVGSMKEADTLASQEGKASEILRNNNEKGLTSEQLQDAAQAEAQRKAEKTAL